MNSSSSETGALEPAASRPGTNTRWLNRTTLGVSLASLFSDISHEMATAVLPAFLLTIGGGAGTLGLIEGAADGVSSMAKLWGGVMADRSRRRKPLAAAGYLVTAIATAAIGVCASWWQVLFFRVTAWAGRGSRSPARDVLLAEAATADSQGKAFGLERAGDALGAVLGPLLSMTLLTLGWEARHLLIWSLVPGALAFLAIGVLAREALHTPRPAAFSVRHELEGVGPRFRAYLSGVLVFGCGDFSRTMLILYAAQHASGGLLSLGGAALAVALYVLHNAVSAAAALPLGVLADRVGHGRVITGGYFFAAATTFAFAIAPPTPAALVVLFLGSGLYVACEEVAEKSYAATLLPAGHRGVGMGLLAATNGVGDMLSSALVGGLWSVLDSPAWGFAAAAALQLAGGLRVASTAARFSPQ
jgi:MFS family permease